MPTAEWLENDIYWYYVSRKTTTELAHDHHYQGAITALLNVAIQDHGYDEGVAIWKRAAARAGVATGYPLEPLAKQHSNRRDEGDADPDRDDGPEDADPDRVNVAPPEQRPRRRDQGAPDKEPQRPQQGAREEEDSRPEDDPQDR